METSLSRPLTFARDVLIVPVADLPDETRKQIDCGPGDFAVSRLRSRGGSKIIDPQAAELLSRFAKPHSVVEAAILFGREKRLDPEEVLEGAYPLVRSLLEGGFLVPAESSNSESEASPELTHWTVGAKLRGGHVRRVLQVLDDTEVYLLSGPERHSVLKVERFSRDDEPTGLVGARLRHEATFLAHLAGGVVPELLGMGELEGRSYLELEYVPGVDAATAAVEWRDRGATGRLLNLICSVAETYTALHERGVVHGDVHPRNILVGRGDVVRLIDFGVARATSPHSSLPPPGDRGGVPFFFEPELARAFLAGTQPPPASEAGEQNAVAALIYQLMTGTHWQDFPLVREAMLEAIASRAPLSFSDRGVAAWPEVEAVLDRALRKAPEERFPSMSGFAQALGKVSAPATSVTVAAPAASLGRLLHRSLENAAVDGPWLQAGLGPAPTTSLNFGAAGVSLGILHVAVRRKDAQLLALADVWARRATRDAGSDGAFYNAEIEITRALVGESSPYHSPSGVHGVAALIAAAMGDSLSLTQALEGFVESARRPGVGLDLTLGRSSTLLGAAILLDAVPEDGLVDAAPLRSFGDQALAELWQAIDAMPETADSGIRYAGIAHGWAGILYASLQWCDVSGTTIPAGVERRLTEVAALALPTGRGLDWPWMLGTAGEPTTMAGWCNGTCGYVFLWTLAHRLLRDPRYLDLANGAAWRSWDAPDLITTLCCGMAGRSYALLNVYRHTRDTLWRNRARDLAVRAVREGNIPPEYPHSLYKGEFGLAVLAADLEEPEQARMPFFEPMGYRGTD